MSYSWLPVSRVANFYIARLRQIFLKKAVVRILFRQLFVRKKKT